MRWVGPAARQGKKMSVCKILVTKPSGMRPLGTSGPRLEINIKESLTGKQCGVMPLVRLAQSKIQYRAHDHTIFLLGHKDDYLLISHKF
jgi:hypothetical protein